MRNGRARARTVNGGDVGYRQIRLTGHHPAREDNTCRRRGDISLVSGSRARGNEYDWERTFNCSKIAFADVICVEREKKFSIQIFFGAKELSNLHDSI